MTIYLVLDNSKSDYDCSGIFCEAFATYEDAENYLSNYDKRDRACFDIVEYSV